MSRVASPTGAVAPRFMPLTQQTTQRAKTWPKLTEEKIRTAQDKNSYIHVKGPGAFGGPWKISGAMQAWTRPDKTTGRVEKQDVVYLPDLRLAGHQQDVVAYLNDLVQNQGWDANRVQQALNNAYSYDSILGNPVASVVARYEQEVGQQKARVKAAKREPGVLGPGEISLEAAIWLTKYISDTKGKKGAAAVSAPSRVSRGGRGGDKWSKLVERIGDIINFNRTVTEDKQKVLDVTDLKSDGAGARQKVRPKTGNYIEVQGLPVIATPEKQDNLAVVANLWNQAASGMVQPQQTGGLRVTSPRAPTTQPSVIQIQ